MVTVYVLLCFAPLSWTACTKDTGVIFSMAELNTSPCGKSWDMNSADEKLLETLLPPVENKAWKLPNWVKYDCYQNYAS
jgi:hypothetical protein